MNETDFWRLAGAEIIGGRLKTRNGRVLIRRTTIAGIQTEEREIEVQPFLTTPAMVAVSYELKLQLRPYETAGVFVSITMPCYAEDADATRKDVQAYIGTVIAEEQAAIVKARDELQQAAQEPPL